MDSIDDIATPKHGQRFRVTVFDAIKNGIASVGDPFKQFHGIGFEQSSLAKLSLLPATALRLAA